MPTRPTFLTVIAVLLMVFSALGALGLIVVAALSENPQFQQQLANDGTELTASMIAVGFVTCVLQGIAGFAVWRGQAWGRWLYIGTSVIGLGYMLATTGVTFTEVPSLAITALVIFGLFHPRASAYFRGELSEEDLRAKEIIEEDVDDRAAYHAVAADAGHDPFSAPRVREVRPDETPIWRLLLGYLIYTVGGIAIVFGAVLMAIRIPIPAGQGPDPTQLKIGMTAAALGVALVCVLLGTLTLGRASRAKSAGLMLLVCSGIATFFVTSIMAVMNSDELAEIDPNMVDIYRDAPLGFIVVGLTAVPGLLLFVVGNRALKSAKAV